MDVSTEIDFKELVEEIRSNHKFMELMVKVTNRNTAESYIYFR
jgi:hypothetical protein